MPFIFTFTRAKIYVLLAFFFPFSIFSISLPSINHKRNDTSAICLIFVPSLWFYDFFTLEEEKKKTSCMLELLFKIKVIFWLSFYELYLYQTLLYMVWPSYWIVSGIYPLTKGKDNYVAKNIGLFHCQDPQRKYTTKSLSIFIFTMVV